MKHRFILMNRKTNRFFKEYQGNKPIWTDLPINAAHYGDIEIMKRYRKRLAYQSQETQLVRSHYYNRENS